MKNNSRQDRIIPIGIVAGICAAIVAVGGGITYWINSQSSTDEKPAIPSTTLPTTPPSPIESPTATLPTTPPSSVESPSPVPSASPISPVSPPSPVPSTPPAVQPIQTNAALYWVRDTGSDFELVPMDVLVRDTKEPEVVLATAFNRLLNGAPETNAFSSIPEGTQLLNIAVEDDGIYLNLSKEFTTGGGSASMISRVGQVVYTATSLESNANVWLYVDGQPLELLGGEGLEVPQPTTRENFLQEFQF